jgi:hypothetical protein
LSPLPTAGFASGVQPFGSVNWGGYADIETGSDTATGVSANWTIPRVTCPQGLYVTQPCATDVCLDQSAEWNIERPAFALGTGFQILPLAYYGENSFTNGRVTSGGVTTSIAGFTGGSVNDVFTLDDSLSYYLQCVGQRRPPGQLLLLPTRTPVPPCHRPAAAVSPTPGTPASNRTDEQRGNRPRRGLRAR